MFEDINFISGVIKIVKQNCNSVASKSKKRQLSQRSFNFRKIHQKDLTLRQTSMNHAVNNAT